MKFRISYENKSYFLTRVRDKKFEQSWVLVISESLCNVTKSGIVRSVLVLEIVQVYLGL